YFLREGGGAAEGGAQPGSIRTLVRGRIDRPVRAPHRRDRVGDTDVPPPPAGACGGSGGAKRACHGRRAPELVEASAPRRHPTEVGGANVEPGPPPPPRLRQIDPNH